MIEHCFDPLKFTKQEQNYAEDTFCILWIKNCVVLLLVQVYSLGTHADISFVIYLIHL